jgi:hypothetical protein
MAQNDILQALKAKDHRWVHTIRVGCHGLLDHTCLLASQLIHLLPLQYELPEMLKNPVYHLLHHVASVDVLLKAGMANHVRKSEVDRLRTVRPSQRLETGYDSVGIGDGALETSDAGGHTVQLQLHPRAAVLLEVSYSPRRKLDPV